MEVYICEQKKPEKMQNILFKDVAGLFLPKDNADRFMESRGGFLDERRSDKFLPSGKSFMAPGDGFLPSSGRLRFALDVMNALSSSGSEDLSDLSEGELEGIIKDFKPFDTIGGEEVIAGVTFKASATPKQKRVARKQFRRERVA